MDLKKKHRPIMGGIEILSTRVEGGASARTGADTGTLTGIAYRNSDGKKVYSFRTREGRFTVFLDTLLEGPL